MFKHQLGYMNNILSKKKFLCILLINFILFTLYVIKMKDFTVNDIVVYSLFGYGQGYFDQVEFLRLLIVNGVPIYIIGVLISEENFSNKMFLIRFKSILKSFKTIQITYLLLIIFYIVIQVSFAYVFGIIFGLKSNDYLYLHEISMYNFNKLNFFALLYSAVILRVAELMFIQILLISCYSILKNSIASFFISMGTYIFLTFTSIKFFPSGISSISRFIELDSQLQFAFFKAMLILICSYFICYIYIHIKGHKTLYD